MARAPQSFGGNSARFWRRFLGPAILLLLPQPFWAQELSLRSINTELSAGQSSYYLATRCAGFYKTVFLVSGGETSDNPLVPRSKTMLEWLFASAVQTRLDRGEEINAAANDATVDINVFHDIYIARIADNLREINEAFDDLIKSDLRTCSILEEQRLSESQ